jgi:hypothetical protein
VLSPRTGQILESSTTSSTDFTAPRTAGSHFYYFLITNTYVVSTLSQNLANVVAGESISCSAFYNFYGNFADIGIATFSLEISVDGQSCGSQQPTGQHGDWVQVKSRSPVIVLNNSPQLTITVTVPNPTADIVAWSLDDIQIIRNTDSALAICLSTIV